MSEAIILETVRAVLGAHTTERRLFDAPPAEVALQSLGIASVDMIGIVIELEERFGHDIDDLRLHELHSLADLVNALEDACHGT
jgi:acyl carrier protein